MRLFRRLNRRSKDKWQLTLLAVAFSFAGFAQGQGAGYWHTNGRLILDERNQQVRITGINWYGFETDKAVANGLYAQDYRTVLQTVRTQGFNTVRIPLSSQMIETPIAAVACLSTPTCAASTPCRCSTGSSPMLAASA
jgi:endoglucanase